MTNNPYPEKIFVEDVEVSNPEHDAWNHGYKSALQDAVKHCFSMTKLVPLWLYFVAGKKLVDEVLAISSPTPPNRYASQFRK